MLSEQAQLQQVANIAGIRIPAQVSVKNHHVILNERRFHYREWGKPSAPGLLFLHGGNQTCHTWNVICAALSDQYHCIAVDQRGHGDSEWSYEGDYAPASQMQDIVALIEHLEWPSLTIIGMSMGCLVGLYYAIKYGSRLNAFVAIDAGPMWNLQGLQRSRVLLTTINDMAAWKTISLQQWLSTQDAIHNYYGTVCSETCVA